METLMKGGLDEIDSGGYGKEFGFYLHVIS
jgi:hypothetical protein